MNDMHSICFFFSSRRRHTRCGRDWSSDVCSSDLHAPATSGLSTSSPLAGAWFGNRLCLGREVSVKFLPALTHGLRGGVEQAERHSATTQPPEWGAALAPTRRNTRWALPPRIF